MRHRNELLSDWLSDACEKCARVLRGGRFARLSHNLFVAILKQSPASSTSRTAAKLRRDAAKSTPVATLCVVCGEPLGWGSGKKLCRACV